MRRLILKKTLATDSQIKSRQRRFLERIKKNNLLLICESVAKGAGSVSNQLLAIIYVSYCGKGFQRTQK